MKIIHQDKNRILIGNHEDGWIIINTILSNGHMSKLIIPDSLVLDLSNWLRTLKLEIMERIEEYEEK